MERFNTTNTIISVGLILALLAISVGPPAQVVRAAALTGMSAVLSSVKISADADEEIMFITPTGIASGAILVLTYDSDFDTTDVVFTDIDLSFQATPDGVCTTGDTSMTLVAGAPVTTSMGFVNTSSTVLTFTNGTTAIDAASEVCILIGTNASGGTNTMKNATTANSYNLVFSGDFGDTGTIVITTVADDVVVTTATVAASLSFAITGDNAIGFGTLSSSASRWANDAETGNGTAASAHDLTAGTNSTSGYTITVKGATITSTGTPGDTISAMGTEATLTTGQEEFGLRITSSGGTCAGSEDADYDNSPSDTYFYGATSSTTDVIVTCASASAITTYSLYYAANIAADTEAHTDYTASLVYIATGNF